MRTIMNTIANKPLHLWNWTNPRLNRHTGHPTKGKPNPHLTIRQRQRITLPTLDELTTTVQVSKSREHRPIIRDASHNKERLFRPTIPLHDNRQTKAHALPNLVNTLQLQNRRHHSEPP